MKNLVQVTAILVLAGALSLGLSRSVNAQMADVTPQAEPKAVSDVKKVADVNPAGIKAVPAGSEAVVVAKSAKEVEAEHKAIQKQIDALKKAHVKEHGPLEVETEEVVVEAGN